MKKKIIIISLVIIVLMVLVSLVMWKRQIQKNNYDKAVEEAKEEFTFDYNEEIVIISVERFNDDYIITIYGEENYGIYLYKNGEIWNYVNQSN